MWHRNQHDAAAALGLMRYQCAGNDAAPVVADPDRRLAAKMLMKLRHVRHDLLVGIRVVGCRCGGSTIAAQIGSHAVPTVGGERVHLITPYQTQLRPAVKEEDQRS